MLILLMKLRMDHCFGVKYFRNSVAADVGSNKDCDIVLVDISHDVVVCSDKPDRGNIEVKTRLF